MKRRTMLQTLGAGTAFIGFNTQSNLSAQAASKNGDLKLGLVTYNMAKDWDVDTIIKNCSETGFQGVELRTTHAHGVEVSLSASQRKETKKQFEDSPITLIGLGSAFDYHTPDQAKLKKDIEATKEYMKLAHDVGASGIKVRPNALPKDVPKEKTLEQIGLSLREVGAFGADYGVQIRVEVHGRDTSDPRHMKTMMDTADHPNVGVCWNSNANDLSGLGWDANFDLLKSKIFSVHMRDLYDEEYPYRKLYAGLNEIGFKGFCMAEIQGSDDPIRVMKYYRGLWQALQDII
ncbi:MAG: sugar phosphate isomerase/epimerase family protein [Candidatus Hinthialibacter antarcticus]|nr:sugar phosphate isomerase/epimerase family protein [Candidatus Hinthialibacter antarcticus]